MRIRQIAIYPYRLRLRRALITSRQAASTREGLLLRLEDTSGKVGWGDAAPWPGFSTKSVGELQTQFSQIAPQLLERNANSLVAFLNSDALQPPVLEVCSECRFAIETAAIDLLAQREDVPMCRFLNQHSARAVDVNALTSEGDDGALEEEIRRIKNAGFGTVKLKIGSADLDSDVRRVQAARKTLGEHVNLRLDANQGWDYSRAREILPRLARFAPEYVEEPCRHPDVLGLQELHRASGVPIALDESLTNNTVAERMIGAKAVHVFILKPQFHGGFSGVRQLSKLTRQSGITVVITSALESAIGVAASAHCAAAFGDSDIAHGLATSFLFESDVSTEGLRIENGRLMLLDRPGLGVAPDTQCLTGPIGQWTL